MEFGIPLRGLSVGISTIYLPNIIASGTSITEILGKDLFPRLLPNFDFRRLISSNPIQKEKNYLEVEIDTIFYIDYGFLFIMPFFPFRIN